MEYLNSQEAAALYKLSRSCLAKWRVNGSGPPFIKLGGSRVAYLRSELDAWAAERARKSTSDTQ